MGWQYSGKTEQRVAAIKRRADARELAKRGPEHTRGAMYLAGYAIECKIKSIAMERFHCSTLDELRSKRSLDENVVFSHALEPLLRDLLPHGVWNRLLAAEAGVAFTGQVNRWSSNWRYNPRNPTEVEARKFLQAVEVMWKWLEVSA